MGSFTGRVQFSVTSLRDGERTAFPTQSVRVPCRRFSSKAESIMKEKSVEKNGMTRHTPNLGNCETRVGASNDPQRNAPWRDGNSCTSTERPKPIPVEPHVHHLSRVQCRCLTTGRINFSRRRGKEARFLHRRNNLVNKLETERYPKRGGG